MYNALIFVPNNFQPSYYSCQTQICKHWLSMANSFKTLLVKTLMKLLKRLYFEFLLSSITYNTNNILTAFAHINLGKYFDITPLLAMLCILLNSLLYIHTNCYLLCDELISKYTVLAYITTHILTSDMET